MRNLISKVLTGSIAEEVGIEQGDKLLSINESNVKDIVDYKYLIVDEEVVLEIEKEDGEIWEVEIEKEYGEDIGLEFSEGILDKPMRCHNKCIFCFIDQNPKGMRETLYFKDDDSRLSFLQGNFITMTNMKEEDIDRIIKYRISPINISVHTTNGELRKKMLNNRFADNIYPRMQRLAEAGIDMNAQIVAIPGYNNGVELINTIEDLYKLYPHINNVAVVPIGVTKFREGLKQVETYDAEKANKELDLVEKLQKRYYKEIGEPFVRLSDEFYVVAGREIPETEFYGDFDQIEDGIGMIRTFRDAIDNDLHKLNRKGIGKFTIPTGVSAYEEIKKGAEKIMDRNPNIKIEVIKVINKFYGEKITVTGLIVGEDLISSLRNRDNGIILLCSSMFRKGYEPGDESEKIMLDNTTLDDLKETLDTNVVIVDFTGEDLIDTINKYCHEEE